ncbi:response regulator transcription factor [Agathobaculum sp. Marseille-P7918]|uniref:response regulator transcription factor n=1 Tax=Agathobaculum sp. Marseille-P7918 TaxID=2479843 RepID=UPI003563B326
MNQILIVEDDAALGRGLTLALSDGTRVCTLARNCAEARQALQHTSFSLALFDVNLPDGSGLTLLEETRAAGGPPVILLTANDLETDIVTGLTLGADDYITKPFSLAVLRARVEAALRRTTPAKSPAVFRQNGFVFDFDALCFSVNGRALQLSQTEQRLLRLLVDNCGHTVPRDTLIDRIWTDGAEYVDENALSVTVGRLRRKLGTDAPIQTVYGVGYGWAVDR